MAQPVRTVTPVSILSHARRVGLLAFMGLFLLVGGTWTAPESQASCFSLLRLVDADQETPTVELVHLMPSAADLPLQFTLTVELSNSSDQEVGASLTVNVKPPGAADFSDCKEITLPGNGARQVQFRIRTSELGVYEAKISESSTELATVHFLVGPMLAAWNLTIEPTTVKPEEPVTISLDIMNLDESSGEGLLQFGDSPPRRVKDVPVTLNVKELDAADFVPVAVKKLELEYGHQGRVEFLLSREQLGGYEVEVEGLRGAFKVTSSGFSLLPLGEAGPNFVIKNLVVEPEAVKPGEQVAISVDVINEGDRPGSFSAILSVRAPGNMDFRPVAVKEITLGGGEKGTMRFFLSREQLGRYEVDLAGMRGAFEVTTLDPPIRLGPLTITPEHAVTGQPVSVRVHVETLSQAGGRTEIEFRVNGVLFELRSVAVPGRSGVEVVFEFTPPVEGEFALEVVDAQGTVEPRRGVLTARLQETPASFEFSDLRIAPQEVEPGQDVLVTVLVTNFGERPAEVMVQLLVDGAVTDRQELTVPELSTEPVTFKMLAPDSPGTYEVIVGNIGGVLRVGEPDASLVRTSASLLSLVPPLAIAPTQVKVGETLTIGAVVRNSGDVEDEIELVLRAEGEEMRRKRIIVPGGEDVVVKFEVAPKDPGVYEVQLDAPSAPEVGVLRGLVSVSGADSLSSDVGPTTTPTPTPTPAPAPKLGTDESKGFCSTSPASSGAIYGGWLLLSLLLVGLVCRTRCWPSPR